MRTLLAATAAAVTALVIGTAGTASAEPVNDPPGVVAVNPATPGSVTASARGAMFEDHAPITAQIDGGGSDVSPLSETCLSFEGHQACFEDYGDKFRVYEGKKDGASALAFWKTNYGDFGYCYNSNKAGTWHTCNYNLREAAGSPGRPATTISPRMAL